MDQPKTYENAQIVKIDTIDKGQEKVVKIKQEKGIKVKKESWLNHNIQAILSLMLLVFAFLFFWYVLKTDITEKPDLKDIIILLVGIVSTLVTTVITFFFGSSQSSKEKTRHIVK